MGIIWSGDGHTIKIDGIEVDTITVRNDIKPGIAAAVAARARVEGRAAAAGKNVRVLVHIKDAARGDYIVGIRPANWTLPAVAAELGLEWYQFPPRPAGKGVLK